jgi:hypothetical protein
MAQKIIIPAHTVLLTDLQNAAPNGKMKKIFFQCVLREIRNNGVHLEAHLGLIAYPSNKPFLGSWTSGAKVECVPDYTQTFEFDLANYPDPIGFANKELHELINTIKDVLKEGGQPNAALILTPTISANPHLALNATLGTSTEALNPSPPADPYR